MKQLVLFVLLILAAASYGHAQAQPVAQSRSLTSFTAIEVTDGIYLTVREGETPGAVVQASTPQLRAMIKTVVEGPVLKVYFDASADPSWRGLVGSREVFAVAVTLGELHALTAAKGAEVTLESPQVTRKGSTLTVQLRSGARLAGAVRLQALDVQLRGGATAQLTGSAATLTLRATEGSGFLSPALRADECTAVAISASSAQVVVTKTLDARAVNAATITYSGPAALTQAHEEQGGKIVHI